jgi:hypothetical protein
VGARISDVGRKEMEVREQLVGRTAGSGEIPRIQAKDPDWAMFSGHKKSGEQLLKSLPPKLLEMVHVYRRQADVFSRKSIRE